MTNLTGHMTDIEKARKALKDKDYKKALELLPPFINHKNSEAQYLLAFMYENGLGVPQNYDLALEGYKLSSDQNNLEAHCRMGAIYYYGLMGIPQNPQNQVTARTHLEKAAQDGKGIPEAQYIMGLIYENGQSVVPCPVLAHMWYNLAVANGHRDSAIARERVAENMSLKDIRQAQRQALEWFEK